MNYSDQPSGSGNFWKSTPGVALCAFLAIGGLLLIIEHRDHALGWLPWLLVLACPLMHLFMHRGHSGHAGREEPRSDAKKSDSHKHH